MRKKKNNATGSFYPIRIASDLTGLSIDTLRAWEKRYQAITPSRQGSLRMYQEEDIKKLKHLAYLTSQGHAIRTIAHCSVKELESLISNQAQLNQESINNSKLNNESNHALGLCVLKQSIKAFNALELREKIKQLATFQDPRDLIYHTIIPLMRWVGEAWHLAEISIAQEHMTTAIIRELLISMPVTKSAHKKVILLATLSGEWHELGILIAGFFCQQQSCKILYLGVNTPVDEIVRTCHQNSVHMVLLGVTKQIHLEASWQPQINHLEHFLPKSISIWVGGISQTFQKNFLRTKAIESFETFEIKLAQWLGNTDN